MLTAILRIIFGAAGFTAGYVTGGFITSRDNLEDEE